MSRELVDAISNIKEKEALEIVESLLDAGSDPMSILDSAFEAMEMVGKRFEKGEYFLPELIMSGELLKEISDRVKPRIKNLATVAKKGKVLMGTVEGDIHNIGKDIVGFLLDVNGFEVRDIGVDVPPAAFVKEIEEFQPQVVGMSGLLTVAYESMKSTVAAVEEAGLRKQAKIMIGGGQMSERIREFVGADAFGKDAMEGVELAKKWIGDR